MKHHFSDYITIYIHQSDLIISNYIKNLLSPFNIAPEQNLILLLLWENDGLSQSELSAKLGKDKTNIARMVLNLEQKGLIRRVSDENDRRLLKVFLTEKGRKFEEQVIPVIDDFNDQVLQGISEEELNAVRRVLAKLIDNVR
ncbi:MarR family transcriptional regulator [Paenibacillus sediminis]|uniref:DNA-binding MarR family transcriptional regulator n=1 Tax=Paenibacillus sediminis TaxID=664909 RepID=A0ABS4H472_9BACL|nr:MarR family transcriptional regulator [Paenibacillus sediminis]MBP1937251.1 DNA-binding MarR family transcriptional regulator [Paenibacillus sediminis]